MPELPNVKHFRNKFEKTSLDKPIQRIKVKNKQNFKLTAVTLPFSYISFIYF